MLNNLGLLTSLWERTILTAGRDARFEQGADLLLLAAGELRSSLEKPSHLAGWTRAAFLYPLEPTKSSTETLRAFCGDHATLRRILDGEDLRVFSNADFHVSRWV